MEVRYVINEYDLKEYVEQSGYKSKVWKIHKGLQGIIQTKIPHFGLQRDWDYVKIQKASGFCPHMNEMFAKGNVYRMYLC